MKYKIIVDSPTEDNVPWSKELGEEETLLLFKTLGISMAEFEPNGDTLDLYEFSVSLVWGENPE